MEMETLVTPAICRKNLRKWIIIYMVLLNGWQVERLSGNEFKFTKNNTNIDTNSGNTSNTGNNTSNFF